MWVLLTGKIRTREGQNLRGVRGWRLLLGTPVVVSRPRPWKTSRDIPPRALFGSHEDPGLIGLCGPVPVQGVAGVVRLVGKAGSH